MHDLNRDEELLTSTAQQLRIDVEALMRRYYGAQEDAHHELEQLNRTGRLQESFAQLLRQELTAAQTAAK
jgi:hypothetical protein